MMINAENEEIVDKEEGDPKGLTNGEICGQALSFFLAGYDTAASTMSLFMYNIATHPDAQGKLLAEIDENMPAGQEPTYESLNQLEYLDMCFSETLRLYPPGLRVDRITSMDCEINGVKIPKGMIIGIPIFAIHHDPDRWENPEMFDPERFSPENKSRYGLFDYMPFGQGPRNCVGMRLALLEAKMNIIKILQKFKFSPCEKTQIPLKLTRSRLLKPEKGLWLKIENRT